MSPSETIVANYPYTMMIVGHTHTYRHQGHEVIVGNGGAPRSGSVKWGYVMAERRSDGVMVFTDYDYELFINSKFIRRLKSDEEQIVSEVTRHLNPGKNTITFVAKKRPGKERKSFSPQHFFRVIIGEGAAGGDKVMIDEALVTFTKTAADTEDVTQEFTLNTR